MIEANGNRWIGTTSGVAFYSSGAMVVSIERDGSVGGEIANRIVLYQNYPNPFNSMTAIQFSVPRRTNLNLTIYNLLGQAVSHLVEGEVVAGTHEVIFDANSLPSGVYIYRL